MQGRFLRHSLPASNQAPQMNNAIRVQLCSFLILTGVACRFALAAPAPTQSDIDKVNTGIKSSDKGPQDAAIAQIKDLIASAHPVRNLWVDWIPGLMKDGRNDDAAELALLGSCERPDLNAIVPMMELRVNALLASGKNDDALAAAKSYYNVCDMKLTGKAVDMLALCLARTHPDDLEIARRFRNEQAASSASPQASASAATTTPTTQTSPMLKAIVIDQRIWDDSIKTWAAKTSPVSARAGYGDLLLAADRGADAEKAYREMYQLAATQADLTTAIEGIARSLRAEDGNVGRANAWLVSLQKTSVANP
jgi:hypothetical protein